MKAPIGSNRSEKQMAERLPLNEQSRAKELLEYFRRLPPTSRSATPPEILQALRDPDVIDEVRGMTEVSDRDLILTLARSEVRDYRLAAHILGRRFIHETQDRDVFVGFEQGYARAIAEGDLFLQISFFHDLMENVEFAVQNRREFAELVRLRRSEVRDVILQYSRNDEEIMLETFQNRLCGVLTSKAMSRHNAPGKAFLYALYLGCLVDPGRRERARQTLDEWKEKGDQFFQDVARFEIEQLSA